MSEEQFSKLGARFDELERHMKVLAEANLMTREYLSAEIQTLRKETNQRIDGVEANLGRFTVRVGERFDKLEARFDEFSSETQQRLGKLEGFAEDTQQRLGKLEGFAEDTQQRLGRLEAQGDETRKQLDQTQQQLKVLGDDTQQRLKRIEGHLSLKSTSSARTPPRATPTSLTKRLKKS